MFNFLQSESKGGVLNFQDEDLKLLHLFKNGDNGSFEILVKKHQNKIINLAYKILQNYEDACDIAQEVFLCAYKKIKSFKEKAKFCTWLYRITINLTRNYLKKIKREKKFKNNLMEGKALFDPLLDNDNDMERENIKEKIFDVLNSLNYKYKEIIILRDMEELSYEEISYLLKINIGTVKSRLARARANFIEIFEKISRRD